MSFTVRDAVREDVDTIMALIIDLAVYQGLREHCHAKRDRLEDNLFNKQVARAMIAEQAPSEPGAAPTPAGYVLFFTTFSTFTTEPSIYLEDIYVKHEFRRHGVGRLLFQRLAQHAIEHGCQRIDWSVLHDNTSAQSFYASIGGAAKPDWQAWRLEGAALARLGAAPAGPSS